MWHYKNFYFYGGGRCSTDPIAKGFYINVYRVCIKTLVISSHIKKNLDFNLS